MQSQNREIKVVTLKKIKNNTYKLECEPWFFEGEDIISNTVEIFKVLKDEVADEIGDWYTIESDNEITPANLKRIETFKIKR